MSAVPEVVDGLVALLRAHPGLSGVQVLDGPPVEEVQQDALVVAYTPVGADAADSSIEVAGMSGDAETVRIRGLATAWRGDEQNISAVRARSYELVGEVRAALKNDLRIGGAAARGRVTSTTYMPEQTTRGAIADVAFTVTVERFLR